VAPVRVLIEAVDCKPGSGDYEDDEEEREDKVGRFYRLAYSAAGDPRICNGGGYFSSLEDAIREAEKVFKGIQWK
jgi:hypothetical protein